MVIIIILTDFKGNIEISVEWVVEKQPIGLRER